MILEKFIGVKDPAMWIIIIVAFAGLGLFLYGINTLSNSLKVLAGSRLKLIIEKSTNSPLKGILVGALITILIQSSSGTTALIVGLVSAGLMSLPQAIGVIMGANIGTTVTTVLTGLPVADYFMAFAGIGAFIYFFAKKKKTKEIGVAIFGFGLLFVGLNLMGGSLSFIFGKCKNEASYLFAYFSNIPILGLLVGTVFTAMVQSSAASIGILQTLYYGEIIEIKGALAILIGSNIGTTITAVMAATGATTEAKRTAAVHAMFNIFGAVIFMFLIWPVDLYGMLMSAIEQKFSINRKLTIAIAHIIFNLGSTFILFWFRNYMAKIACKIFKSKEEKNPIYNGLSDYSLCKRSPELALEFVKTAIDYMSDITVKFFRLTMDYSFSNIQGAPDTASGYEDELDELDKLIHDYLIKITQVGVNKSQSNVLSKYLDTIKDLERIGDHLTNIIEYFEQRYAANLVLSDEGAEDLKTMFTTLDLMVVSSTEGLSKWDKNLAQVVYENEDKVDIMEETFRKRHVLRLNNGKCSISNLDYFVDMLSDLERIGDHTTNIASNIINDEYLESKFSHSSLQ